MVKLYATMDINDLLKAATIFTLCSGYYFLNKGGIQNQ